MTTITVLTPTTEANTGWGRYSKGVINHLAETHDLNVIADLPAPTTLIGRPDLTAKSALKVRRRLTDTECLLSLVSYPYSLLAYLSTIGMSIPYFICCHGTYAVKPLHKKQCVGAATALRNATGLFPVSEFTASNIKKALPAIDKIHVTRNGILIDSFERKEPFDVSHEVLLTVAPLKKRKGQLQSVTAFAEAADAIPDVEYHLVGGSHSDGYQREIEEVISSYGIEDRVHFEGFVSEESLYRWYETADVFILTSQFVDYRFEGFPLVYLEAQRYGSPAIGIETTSANEAISHEETGLCTENTIESISSAIQQLFTDDNLRDELSTNAEVWALNHSWSNVADIITEVIYKHHSNDVAGTESV